MAHSKPSKFIGFFNLVEAMKAPGCPVCARILDETRRSMDGFLYENVNDGPLREQIRRDCGLCHRHSWQLARFGDALGGAILMCDVLESVIPKIDARAMPLSRKPTQAQLGQQVCLFCRSERQIHDGVITELATHIADEELKSAWQGCATLCIPHLTEVARQIRDPIDRDRLIEDHREKYQKLCDEMRLLIARQSYDRRDEGIGAEKDSWLRAIEALVGKSGVR